MESRDIHIFIPSYHRPNNLRTVKYLDKMGWDMTRVHVVIDSEADDAAEYQSVCDRYGCELHIFDMRDARERYDFVHRASVSRRAAGLARNTFQEIALEKGIPFYCVMDDDTQFIENYSTGRVKASVETIKSTFVAIEDMMRRHHIGAFAIPQSGDFIGGVVAKKRKTIYLRKMMNCTFYLLPYIYRAERGQQDDDASMFCGICNAGLFAGTAMCGLSLHQMPSATQKGGLTDLYNECKLLNKALTVPIQFPSAVWAERQKMNGGRLHHRINYNYLVPKIMKIEGGRSNIEWDAYPEDVPFTQGRGHA